MFQRGILCLASLTLMAGISEAHVSAISAATARSGRAAIESYDVPFLNPAGIAYVKGYNFASGVSRLRSPEGALQEEFALSLADNTQDTVVPTNLAYVQKKDVSDGTGWVQKDLRLSLGNFISGRNALGLGLVYRQDEESLGKSQQLNLVLGSLVALSENLGLAVVLENVAPMMNSGTPRERLSSRVGMGLSYIHGRVLRSRLDLTSGENSNFGLPTLAVGLENYWNRWLIFRLGASRDQERREDIRSAGFGFDGPRLGIHYAFQSVVGEQTEESRHSIDLGFPLW